MIKEFNTEKALEYYNEENNITQACKRLCAELEIPYSEMYRNRLSRLVNKVRDLGVDNDLENSTSTETNQYGSPSLFLMPSAWEESLNRFLSIEEFCDKYGLNKATVKSSKLVSHNQSHMTYNIAFYTPEEESLIDIDKRLEDIISNYACPNTFSLPEEKEGSGFITNLTFTDTHVGLDPNEDNHSLFGGKWDNEELMKRLDTTVLETVKISKKYKSDILYIRDLGDLADGYNKETARGGHELPQNMSNVDIFDNALNFKLTMLNKLFSSGQYRKIHCHSACNSNHGGDFDYFINSAFKQIGESWSNNIEIYNHRKFIFHYGVGDHCFVGSHGKDMDTLKFGFKPVLDSKSIEKIDGYIKANGLYQKYKYFHFIKGDSHIFLLDFSTSQDFNYFNYPAFSPSSRWVQNNFKRGISSFVVETFHPQEEEINFHYKKFDWVN